MTYYGEITLGDDSSQSFKMLFDTGTCDTWVVGSACTTKQCEDKNKYENSASAKIYESGTFALTFREGQSYGYFVKDTLSFENFVLKEQMIGVGKIITLPHFSDVNWDGVVGLAYPNNKYASENSHTFFHRMADQLRSKGLPNMFSIWLGDDDGSIIFGGWNQIYKYDNSHNWAWATLAETNYWTLELVDMHKIWVHKETRNEKWEKYEKPVCPWGCKGVVDTGSFYIYAPSKMYDIAFGDIHVSPDCDNLDTLPDIAFHFAGISRDIMEIRMMPEDYVVDFNNVCSLGVKREDKEYGWTFGQLLIRSFYTIFDFDNQRIGYIYLK